MPWTSYVKGLHVRTIFLPVLDNQTDQFWHTLPLRWLCYYYRHSDLQDIVKTQWPMNSEKICNSTAVKVTYSTGHGHCSITRVFHVWKSAILHTNSTRKRHVKHLCKNIHAKIHVLSVYSI